MHLTGWNISELFIFILHSVFYSTITQSKKRRSTTVKSINLHVHVKREDKSRVHSVLNGLKIDKRPRGSCGSVLDFLSASCYSYLLFPGISLGPHIKSTTCHSAFIRKPLPPRQFSFLLFCFSTGWPFGTEA